MSDWNKLSQWLYGDVKKKRGFWYAHPLDAVDDLTEEQLFWIPDENCLCMLWHIGHIAHRERLHIGRFLQGIKKDLIPPQYEVFGAEWCSVAQVRESIDSIENVFHWVCKVRDKSTDFVKSLHEDDWHKIPPTSESELTTAHWVFITISHGALHIGKIQMLRAMLERKHDNPC